MRVALSTHINADGDGCGSGTALARLLMQRGMKAFIVNPTPWPEMYDFLLGADVVDRSPEGAAALRDADLLIVHDISDVKRLGVLADAVRKLEIPKLVIDHHLPSDEPPSEITLSDTRACATGELVFDFASVLKLDITAAIARSLYAAILTDTGGFRFSNTSPRCHAIAAALLKRAIADLRGEKNAVARHDGSGSSKPFQRRLPDHIAIRRPLGGDALLAGDAVGRRSAPMRPVSGVQGGASE